MTAKPIMRFISFMMSVLAMLLEDRFYRIRKGGGTREGGRTGGKWTQRLQIAWQQLGLAMKNALVTAR